MRWNRQFLTQGNLKLYLIKKCRKCARLVDCDDRVDCIDMQNREATYCFPCYEKELSHA